MLLGLFFAFCTALSWSWGSYCSSRIAKRLGAARANGWRLSLACLGLALVALLLGGSFGQAGLCWFVIGGALHLGVGDLFLYTAYRRLGARRALLLNVCCAAPITGVLAWLWMNELPSAVQGSIGVAIIACVAAALLSEHKDPITQRHDLPAWLCGFLGACGMAVGAVATRYGFGPGGGNAQAPIADLLALSAVRIAAGASVVLLWLGLRRVLGFLEAAPPGAWQGVRPWMAGAVVFGPLVGVTCYVLAFSMAPSALVQAVVATLPVLVMPITAVLDGDRPNRRSLCFAVLAVLCTIVLAIATWKRW